MMKHALIGLAFAALSFLSVSVEASHALHELPHAIHELFEHKHRAHAVRH